jgi:hypothetical protein
MIVTATGLTIAEGHEIAPGMIATHSVGSDSYAVIVSGIERFKSGARKGQIKAITTVNAEQGENGEWIAKPHTRMMGWIDGEPIMEEQHDRFLPRVIGPCTMHKETERYCHYCKIAGETRYNERCEGKVAYWSSLVVGYARDYRDPSF